MADWHFTNAELSPWAVRGTAISSELMNSRTVADTKFAPGGLEGGAGVRYIQLSCADNAKDCGSLYQDIPIGDLPNSTSYDYEFSGVIADQGEGDIDVSLSQLDAQGHPLWEDHFTARVLGSLSKMDSGENSIYNAEFLCVPEDRPGIRAETGRGRAKEFSLAPRTAKRYDLMDAWVLPR